MSDNFFTRLWKSNVVGQFICINLAVYIIAVFIDVFSLFFNNPSWGVEWVSLFGLPASPLSILYRPWTLLTYMFLHTELWHILWNMLALYAFGKIFLNFYSVRHFVGIYVLGGLFGGILFVVAFNVFPYFAPFVNGAPLVGASAAVLAIVAASAVRSPNYRVVLFLFGSVRLSTIAWVTFLLSFLMLTGDNPGGNFAHLGGMFAGWLVAFLLNKGYDLTNVVNRPLDLLSRIFKKRPRTKKKTGFKFSRGGGSATKRSDDYAYNARKKADEAEVDKILEKIKKGGYASLSEAEKKRLFEASSKR